MEGEGSSFRWGRGRLGSGGQHFQGSVEVSDIEQKMSSVLWRGDAKNKLPFFPDFAHLQFQTGCSQNCCFCSQPHPDPGPYPTHNRPVPCVSFNCFFPSSGTLGPHQPLLSSRPPSHPAHPRPCPAWSGGFTLKVQPRALATASILFSIPPSSQSLFLASKLHHHNLSLF